MFDSIILGKNDGKVEEKIIKNPDNPIEEEDEEYSYYPKQLDYFKTNYPEFKYKSLDEIPAIMSEPLRSCDNTQYSSISRDDVKDTSAILYSVPFYGPDKKFKGIISAIYRVNFLEATLLNLPFLPINEEEKERASKDEIKLPPYPQNFLLQDSKYGLQIFDRRNPKFSQTFEKEITQNSPLIIQEKLNVTSDTQWKLGYLVSEKDLEASLLKQWENEKKSQAISTLLDTFKLSFEKVSQGDLRLNLTTNTQDDFGGLYQYFNKFITDMSGHIKNIADFSKTVLISSNELSDVMKQLGEQTTVISSSSSDISLELSELNTLSHNVSRYTTDALEHSREANYLSEEAVAFVENSMKKINSIGKEVHRTILSFEELNSTTSKIDKMALVISNIAEQSKLLAFNASIEASRVGTSGSGFLIIANEMRKLSEYSLDSANTIQKLLLEIQQKTERMTSDLTLSNASVTEGINMVQSVRSKTLEIQTQIHGITNRINENLSIAQKQNTVVKKLDNNQKELAEVAINNSACIEESIASIDEVAMIAKKLKEFVDMFKI